MGGARFRGTTSSFDGGGGGSMPVEVFVEPLRRSQPGPMGGGGAGGGGGARGQFSRREAAGLRSLLRRSVRPNSS